MSDAQGEDLLEAYDARLRGRIPDPLPKGVSVERDGPLLRFVGLDERGFVDYRDLDGLEGAELDELIARQVRFFGERGLRFEWKHRSHDRPADLTDRLLAAGFVPEDVETVLIARVADITGEVSLPEGATLREVTELRDLRRLEAMEHAIWGGERHRMAERLDAERTADPDGITILIDRSRRRGRLRLLGQVRARGGVRDALGRRNAPRLARPRDLPRGRRLPRESGRRARPPVRPGGRIGREPPDPRAARFHRRDENDAVHLVAVATYGLTML